MRDLKTLEREIEVARRALEETIETGVKDEIYQRSIFLDKLIEEYLDLKESSTDHH